jgi:hypothetical protein
MLGRVRTSLQLKESFHRHDGGTYRQSALALQASTILRSDDRHWWHGVQLRFQTELDIRGGRDDWYRLSLGRNVGPSARLEVGTGWSRLDGTAQFTIGISSTGRHAYVNAWMTGQREPGVTTQLAAEGSLLYQADQGRVETYPFRSLGRGGLSGTVFVDTNGNGVLDRGEETVPGARLQADYMLTETDANGHYAIWNLTPFEAANIQVDPESLRNPLWVPTFDLAQVAVTPNGFRRVDLPLVESLEIEGRIRTRAGDALHAPGAVPLKLVQLDGDREYRTRSFSDGEFYLLGVVPGTYRCEIDARWLESRGLSVDPVSDLRLVARSGAGVVTFELVLETTP